MNKSSQDEKKSYRNFQKDFFILLEEGLRSAGRVTKREYDRVSDRVRLQLEKKYGKEKVDQFAGKVKADWKQMADKIQGARDRFESGDSIRKGKEMGVQLLEGLASTIKRAAENLEASLADKVTYHAGQIVDPGVYLCIGCSHFQQVKKRRKLSICKECGGSEFRST